MWCTAAIHNFQPLLFNVNTLDLFFEQRMSILPHMQMINYFCDKNLEALLSKLQICALKLLECFSDNYMKMNSDKCPLILSSNDENKKIELKGKIINNTQVQKLLGVHIDYKLTLLTPCISESCIKIKIN